ncbi:hypothetical protein G9A89_001312 [Geosiphon pyriformis]|nr:hypothetical protein G9A89_001312 [Geosiphon pyriformis]
MLCFENINIVFPAWLDLTTILSRITGGRMLLKTKIDIISEDRGGLIWFEEFLEPVCKELHILNFCRKISRTMDKNYLPFLVFVRCTNKQNAVYFEHKMYVVCIANFSWLMTIDKLASTMVWD